MAGSKAKTPAEQGIQQPPLSQAITEDYSQSLDDQAFLEIQEPLTMDVAGASNENDHASAHRSSPMNAPTPNASIWDFDDESLPNTSTPKSGTGKLPDTCPIPESDELESDDLKTETDPVHADPVNKRVDLSETASTAQRSSPYVDRASEVPWDFSTTPGGAISHIEDDLAPTPQGESHDMPTTPSPAQINSEEVHNVDLPQQSLGRDQSGTRSKSHTLLEISDSFWGSSSELSPVNDHIAATSLNRLTLSSESVPSSPRLIET